MEKQINNPPSGGWNKISLWFTSPTSDLYVHADNHELKWDGSNRLFIGNDGGIGVSLDKGQTFYQQTEVTTLLSSMLLHMIKMVV